MRFAVAFCLLALVSAVYAEDTTTVAVKAALASTTPVNTQPSVLDTSVAQKIASEQLAQANAVSAAVAAVSIAPSTAAPAVQQLSDSVACTYTDATSGASFDLSSIADQDYPGTDSQYSYKMHVCGTVSDTNCVAKAPATFGGSVCQYGNAAPFQYIHLLASWTGTPAPTWALNTPTDPTKGPAVTMANGDSCYNMGVTQPRSVTVNFQCQPTQAQWTIATSPTNPCAYVITFPTPAGCIGSGGKKSSGGLSGGSIFLIILVVVVPVYIAAGCIYKRQKMGTTGMESCPNIDFWRDLPALFKEGCVFTWTKLRGLCGKGDGNYNEVK